MKKIMGVLLFLLFTAAASATHVDSFTMNGDSAAPNKMKLIGQAELSVLWWSVYNAQLYNHSGVFQGLVAPLMLKINYQRDISQQDLIEATEKELKRQKLRLSDEKIKLAVQSFENFWPDITKGDSLTFVLLDDGGLFFHNGKAIGKVTSGKTAHAFLNIWLSDESSYPDLAAQLRGLE